MRKKLSGVLLVAALGVVVGCNPSVNVVRNPGPHARGIRYYRPKPYLLISPVGRETTSGSGDKASVVSEPSADLVQLKLEYLPDFNEEYAIRIRPGLGTNTTSFKLEHGWNLTELNTTLDSKFADNVKAIGDLISKVAPLASPAAPGVGTADKVRTVPEQAASVMYARNVPFGYYEAVIGGDHQSGKRLYGWRYVGFAPFAGCPIEPCGVDAATCNSGSLCLYGLVMQNGVMVFKPLQEAAATDVSKVEPKDALTAGERKQLTDLEEQAAAEKKQLADLDKRLKALEPKKP